MINALIKVRPAPFILPSLKLFLLPSIFTTSWTTSIRITEDMSNLGTTTSSKEKIRVLIHCLTVTRFKRLKNWDYIQLLVEEL